MKTLLLFFLICILNNSLADIMNLKKCCNEGGICVPIHMCGETKDQISRRVNPNSCGFKGNVPLVCCSIYGIFNKKIEFKKCFKSNNEGGICVPIHMCDEAKDQLSRRVKPDSCGFKGYVPLVCCSSYGILSKKKCAEYQGFNYDSDGLVLATFGGIRALSREFPHMAILGFGERNDKQWLCGGTLISEQYVLTAAHCIVSAQYGYVKYVRLGDLNIELTNDTADPQDFDVMQNIPHPSYRPPSKYHDIAILKLDRPATFTEFVKPACLYTKMDFSSDSPVATGWGRLSYGGQSSPHLQKVRLDLYDLETCNQTYHSMPRRQLPNGLWNDTQICAGSRFEIRDTCQGDSGGPLQIFHEKYRVGEFVVIGVTSFGKPCGLLDTPGVYTRVSYYVPWIESIVWSNETFK